MAPRRHSREAPEGSLLLESLLALAKDQRYHRECQRLVQDVLVSDTTSPDDEESDQSVSSASSTSSLASFIASLWTTLVVLRKGGNKTLGMEACGIEYPEVTSKWRVIASMVASALSQWYCLQAPLHQQFDFITDSSTNALNSRRSTRPSESLRGDQRRQYFEQQRRAMMERSSGRQSNPQARASATDRRPLESNLLSTVIGIVRRLVASVSTAMDPGPHSTWGDPSSPRSSSPQRSTQALTVGAWILRVHLAYYCLGGRYASWFHRLFRLSFVKRHDDDKDKLVHRPTTASLVGMLVLAQALGASIPVLARMAFQYLERISTNSATTSTTTVLTKRSKPNIHFVSTHHKRLEPSSTGASTTTRSSSTSSSMRTTTCMICRQVRQHPACPPCGHIFCWTCLQQWLGTGHHHCPYCRTPCRPQEVVALYKF